MIGWRSRMRRLGGVAAPNGSGFQRGWVKVRSPTWSQGEQGRREAMQGSDLPAQRDAPAAPSPSFSPRLMPSRGTGSFAGSSQKTERSRAYFSQNPGS